jgi:hypothetical protein
MQASQSDWGRIKYVIEISIGDRFCRDWMSGSKWNPRPPNLEDNSSHNFVKIKLFTIQAADLLDKLRF